MSKPVFQPSTRILTNYARVLIDFALGTGQGIKNNEVVLLQYDQPALPLALEVFKRILEKGGHPLLKSHDEAFDRPLYTLANKSQLTFFPKAYSRALVDTIDHRLYLIADDNPLNLKGVDPQKIAFANLSRQKLKEWLFEKEDQGKLTWTLALYGTLGAAREAGLSLEKYWEQIIKACYLNSQNPILKWQRTFKEVQAIVDKLNKLPITKIHVTAKNTDLTYTLGEKRTWMGGSGRNIPSFEIFTSPDWRGTEGHIAFDLPLYRYGNLIEGIYLEFAKGRVVKAKARKNEKLLKEIVKQKNADKIGEFSLTDKRFSKIDRFMATTLYDENYGGAWGNTHLALGSSYHDCFRGDAKKIKREDWLKLGYNESVEHTDIVQTADRIVEVTLKNDYKQIIYKEGSFTL